jgi:FkbM family methyltransferase
MYQSLYAFKLWLITHKKGGILGRIVQKLFSIVLRAGDPIVTTQIDGHQLDTYFSSQIPFFMAQFPEYGKNLYRLASYLRFDASKDMIIDVGANIGDGIVLFENACEKTRPTILAIEGNDRYFDLLQTNCKRFDNIIYVKALLSEESGSIQQGLQESHGTAALSNTTSSISQVVTLDAICEQHVQSQHIELIKIDTDGFDGKILRGSKTVLAKHHPILFFEYDPRAWKQQGDTAVEIFAFLSAYDYFYYMFYDNYGNFLGSITADQSGLLVDLSNYIQLLSNSYFDLIAFPRSRKETFDFVRQQEMTHFEAKLTSG